MEYYEIIHAFYINQALDICRRIDEWRKNNGNW